MNRLLCFLGWHDWLYPVMYKSRRFCSRCRKHQQMVRSNDEFGDRDGSWEDV